MTKLVLHYAPGILVILKTDPCPGQRNGYGIGHSNCPCDNNHTLHRTVGTPILLQPGEKGLPQCRLNASTGTSTDTSTPTNATSPSPNGSNGGMGIASSMTPAQCSGP